jgi:hypothetical protein
MRLKVRIPFPPAVFVSKTIARLTLRVGAENARLGSRCVGKSSIGLLPTLFEHCGFPLLLRLDEFCFRSADVRL